MRLMFGWNRRQNPLLITVPGGSIRVARLPHGSVLVEFQASAGEVRPGEIKDYAATVRLLHERKTEP